MESFLREGEPWNLMVRKGVVYRLRTEANAKPSAGPVASETPGRPSNLVFQAACRADHSQCWTHWCWPQSSSGLLSLSLHHDSWSAFLSRLAWTPLVKEASAQHPRASFRGSRGVYLCEKSRFVTFDRYGCSGRRCSDSEGDWSLLYQCKLSTRPCLK